MARSYYSATAADFALTPSDQVLGALLTQHAFPDDGLQREAWRAQIEHLKQLAPTIPGAHVFFEFAIPRMGKRADVVLIYRGLVFVIEYKVGARSYDRAAIEQVLDYALDLKNFHEGSHDATVIPVLVATDAPDRGIDLSAWSDGLAHPILSNHQSLGSLIQACTAQFQVPLLAPLSWEASRYKPTPTILEAAQALYHGHNVQEISRSEAGAENLSVTASFIGDVIKQAKHEKAKAVCFVTGVPGSGKTLAGLNIANERMHEGVEEHAVFLSGNGPLVAVLREALARDELAQKPTAADTKLKKADAKRKANAFIQNIHHFRDDQLGKEEPPIEKVVVFDEAQRAWTKAKTSSFMKSKHGLADFGMSEPEFLLSVMDRHQDWCVVVCLIGGGQEINTGEAGLEEWLTALSQNHSDWRVYTSDRLSSRDYLASAPGTNAISLSRPTQSPALHLGVSVRSFRAEALSDFVGAIIDGDADSAREFYEHLAHYPIAITRDLETARIWLRSQARGSERYGLVASSNAMRLKPVGIHVKAKIDPPLWFLEDKDDIRSSFALEDVATEFDIQGLELDWVGVCWDANFRWAEDQWSHHRFRGSKWVKINDPTRVAYLENAYRVLLTRGRQGMVIFVPEGSNTDATRKPSFYDESFAFLRACGFSELADP